MNSLVKLTRAKLNPIFLRRQRTFASKTPASDPLDLLKKSSERRGFCDANGVRKKDVHWTFELSTSGASLDLPPSLRTIDFQRVTSAGIDFIRKVGHGLTNLTSGKSSSIICSFGKYTTGETVEQWLAEGKCEQMTGMEEGFDLFEVVPERSIVELVASRLVKEEYGLSMEDDHSSMDSINHYLEVVQKTRNRLKSGKLTKDELDKSFTLVRFVPSRMERYTGGPDQAMWDRLEWKQDSKDCFDDTVSWDKGRRLYPY